MTLGAQIIQGNVPRVHPWDFMHGKFCARSSIWNTVSSKAQHNPKSLSVANNFF